MIDIRSHVRTTITSISIWLLMMAACWAVAKPNPADPAVVAAFDRALALYKGGKKNEAKGILENIPVENIEKLPEAVRLLGVVQYDSGNEDAAVATLTKAWNLGSPRALLNLSLIKVKRKEVDWLKTNEDAIYELIRTEPEALEIAIHWMLVIQDAGVFYRGLMNVSDKDIAKNPELAVKVLAAHRAVISVMKSDPYFAPHK